MTDMENRTKSVGQRALAAGIGSEIPDVTGQGGAPPETIPEISEENESAYWSLPFGAKYKGPDGVVRERRAVRDLRDLANVPGGEWYISPNGDRLLRPKYENIGLTGQTLYDMAINDRERRRVLERERGKDRVKQDELTGELYVETDDPGVRLKPGAALTAGRAAAMGLSMAAPVAGGVLGAIGGAPGGPILSGAGAATGAMGGQQVNRLLMSLAGVRDAELAEEVADLAYSGLAAAAGSGVGTGISRLAGRSAEGLAPSSSVATGVLVGRTGARNVPVEELKMAEELMREGVIVPPRATMPDIAVANVVVTDFERALRQRDPMLESAERFYENRARGIAEGATGRRVPESDSMLRARDSEPLAEIGDTAVRRALRDMDEADKRLESAYVPLIDTATERLTRTAEQYQSQLSRLRNAAEANRESAENIVSMSLRAIDKDIDTAFKTAGISPDNGDLFRLVGERFNSLSIAARERTNRMYAQARELGADVRPSLTYTVKEADGSTRMASLQDDARAFIAQLPEPYRNSSAVPEFVKRLTKLESGDVTFAELHELRSILRSRFDYGTPLPNIGDRPYREMEKLVDARLRDVGSAPQLRPAVEMLNQADAMYRRNAQRFGQTQIRDFIAKYRNGIQPNAEEVVSSLFRPGFNELIGEVRKIAGEPVFAALQAAHGREMIRSATTDAARGTVDLKALARRINDADADGVLEAVYGRRMSMRWRNFSDEIRAMQGTLDIGKIENTNLASILDQMRRQTAQADELAKADPLKGLADERKRLEREFADAKRTLSSERRADPLNFLSEGSVTGRAAASRILENADIMMAAYRKFGPESQEWQMLRDAAIERTLRREIGKSGGEELAADIAGRGNKALNDEVVKIMFPGNSYKDLQDLARYMSFWEKSRGGGNIGTRFAAGEMQINPENSMPLGLRIVFKSIPVLGKLGANEALKWYIDRIKRLTQNPEMVRRMREYIERGGEARSRALDFLFDADSARAAGAGAGVAVYETGSGLPERPNTVRPPADVVRPWRDVYQERYGVPTR